MATLSDAITDNLAYPVAVLTATALAWSAGGLFGLTQMQTGVALVALLTSVYIVWTSQSELSIPFFLSLTAVTALVVEFLLPGVVTEPIVGVLEQLGLTFETFDVVSFAVLITLTIIVYWLVQIRAGTGPKTASATWQRLVGSGTTNRKGKLTKLADEWITVGRLTAGFALGVGYLLASQIAQLSGEAGAILAEAPVVAANLGGIVLGFLSAGGEVTGLASIPVVGSPLQSTLNALNLDPVAFAVIAILLLLGAVGVREQ